MESGIRRSLPRALWWVSEQGLREYQEYLSRGNMANIRGTAINHTACPAHHLSATGDTVWLRPFSKSRAQSNRSWIQRTKWVLSKFGTRTTTKKCHYVSQLEFHDLYKAISRRHLIIKVSTDVWTKHYSWWPCVRSWRQWVIAYKARVWFKWRHVE